MTNFAHSSTTWVRIAKLASYYYDTPLEKRIENEQAIH